MYYGTCCGRAPLPFCAFNPVCFVCWLVCSTFWFPSWILRLCSAFHHRRLDWCSSQAPALITAAGLKGLWFRESSLPRVSFLFVASSSCCLLPGALVQINAPLWALCSTWHVTHLLSWFLVLFERLASKCRPESHIFHIAHRFHSVHRD